MLNFAITCFFSGWCVGFSYQTYREFKSHYQK